MTEHSATKKNSEDSVSTDDEKEFHQFSVTEHQTGHHPASTRPVSVQSNFGLILV